MCEDFRFSVLAQSDLLSGCKPGQGADSVPDLVAFGAGFLPRSSAVGFWPEWC